MIDPNDLITEYQIPNWDKIKQSVIDGILNVASEPQKEGLTDITSTSYNLLNENPPKEFPYGDHILFMFHRFFETVAKEQNVAVSWSGNCWHQIYDKGSVHSWHTHRDTNMSSVMYVDIEEGDGTIFKFGDTEYQHTAKEGTIIAFPSALIHRSPKNISDKRRMVMSFDWVLVPNYEKEELNDER